MPQKPTSERLPKTLLLTLTEEQQQKLPAVLTRSKAESLQYLFRLCADALIEADASLGRVPLDLEIRQKRLGNGPKAQVEAVAHEWLAAGGKGHLLIRPSPDGGVAATVAGVNESPAPYHSTPATTAEAAALADQEEAARIAKLEAEKAAKLKPAAAGAGGKGRKGGHGS